MEGQANPMSAAIIWRRLSRALSPLKGETVADPKPQQPSLTADLAMQFLHRAVSTVGMVVAAVFVTGNWILAHVASPWVIPPEVVGITQQAIAQLGVLWLFYKALKKFGVGAAAVFDGTPPVPAPRDPAAPTTPPKPNP